MHYKLALIYDDKLNDPLNALHHFKRFLTLEPSGKRAEEVKGFMKRDELTLLTNLTGDSMVPRSEVVRLRNENLNLRQQIEGRWAEKKAASVTEKTASGTKKQPGEKEKKGGSARQLHRATGGHPGLDRAQVLSEFRALAQDPRGQFRHDFQAGRFETGADAAHSLDALTAIISDLED